MRAGTIEEKCIEGITILTVECGLKGTLEAMLKQRIDDLVAGGCIQIVVNLEHVPYIDSSDIGRLIRSHLSVRRAGGRVRLCHLSEKVLAVLQMTRLDTVLDLYASEEEALAQIRGERARKQSGSP